MKCKISERMTEIIKEELEMKNIEIKEEILEEMLPSSTVEDICTVYIKEEDIKVVISQTNGKT